MSLTGSVLLESKILQDRAYQKREVTVLLLYGWDCVIKSIASGMYLEMSNWWLFSTLNVRSDQHTKLICLLMVVVHGGIFPLAPIPPPPKICIQVLVGVHSWQLYILTGY